MSDELMRTQQAVEKLHRSLESRSLRELVKRRTTRSILLVDVSGSMAEFIENGTRRKIDALREVVSTLRADHPVPVASFNSKSVGLVDDSIPDPSGGTPMASGIDFSRTSGVSHIVMVTDGQTDSEEGAMRSARAFGGQIDVFYVGNGNDRGAKFAQELAAATGGTCNVTDFDRPRELAGKIAGLLGA